MINKLINRIELIKRVQLLSELKENWNGYNASKLSQNVLQNASSLISSFSGSILTFNAFPTARNSIQPEASLNDKYIEIEIFENRFELYFEASTEEEFEFYTINSLINKLNELGFEKNKVGKNDKETNQ